MTGCIVGWAHTKFGKHDGLDVESLIVEVAQGALADAGVSAADIDQVYLGTMNGGFVKQEFPASLVFQADPAFRFKPATRVENACATGSAARNATAFFSASAVCMSVSTTAAAPSDTSEQSVRFKGPATSGFLSETLRQNS